MRIPHEVKITGGNKRTSLAIQEREREEVQNVEHGGECFYCIFFKKKTVLEKQMQCSMLLGCNRKVYSRRGEESKRERC
ncbi:hypothetical protein QOT17_012079 [Balamuthia mandrillaris]